MRAVPLRLLVSIAVLCPRCRIRSRGNICPNCGWAPGARQRSISFQSGSVHSSQGGTAHDVAAGRGAGGGSVQETPRGFQRAGARHGDGTRVIGVAGRSRTEYPSRTHRQQKLKLETLPPAPRVEEPPEPVVTVTSLPREILLSRILAAILDLSLAGLIGWFFCFLAYWALNLDFFSLESLRLGVGSTTGFYLFNSFFFLLGAGQTPGMYFTRLRLVSEKKQESIPVWAVALWIFLYPLATLTLVGLVWGVIDPWRRCIHDRMSGIRVVTYVEPVSAPLPE